MIKPFNLLVLVLLLGLSLPGMGQPMVDSLQRMLGRFPAAVKLDMLESMRKRVDASPNVPDRYRFARSLMSYGRERQDTLVWLYGLEWLADAFQANGEADKALRARRSYRELAVVYGWTLEGGYPLVRQPFGYRYQRIEGALAILEDAGAELDFEDALQQVAGGNYALNDIGERAFRPDLTYWVMLRLRGPAGEGGDFTFVPGSGYGPEGQLFSWDSIGVFVIYPGDSLVEQRTGLALAPDERVVRDAYPFFTVAVETGQEVTLLLRLRGGREHPASREVFLEWVDRSSLHEWDGYRPPARKASLFPEGNGYQRRRIARSLEVLVDDTEEVTIENLWDLWADHSFMNDWRIADWDQIFWVKLRLQGSETGAGPLLLEIPEAQAWDSVEVFWPNERHRFVRQWMGLATPVWKRPLPTSRQLLRIDLLPADTMEVYFRLRGYGGDPGARQIRLYQVWEDSFWPQQPYVAYFRGALLGMLGILFLYNLVSALLRFQWSSVWFGLFLIGLMGVALFWLPAYSGALVWPTGARYFPLLALGGIWLALAALTRYFVALLPMPKYSRAMVRWANFLIVLWSVAVLYLGSKELGWLPTWLNWASATYYLVGAFMALLFTTSLVLSIFAINRGMERGWLILAALVFSAIGAILGGSHYLLYRDLPLQEPILWVSLSAWAVFLVFLLLARLKIRAD